LTPLMLAAARGHVETVKTLVRYRVDPMLRDGAGRSALDHAHAAHQAAVVSELRQAQARLR
jgi:ankyrin repeat protein